MIRAAALAVLLAAAPALGDQTAREIAAENALGAAAAQAIALPDTDRLLAACPADIYASRRNVLRDIFQRETLHSNSYCRDNAEVCAAACKTDQDGKACLALANAMEMAHMPELDLPARRYHALACALGQASGCTNRGGGMRNGPVAGDPWWSAAEDQPAKETCLYRSFQITCTDNDAWGCAMLGQALALGEGTPVDANAARLHYIQTCELTADKGFAACVFAREGLALLDQRPSAP